MGIHRIVQAVEVAAVHAPWFERQRDRYAPEVRARIEAGYGIPAETYLRAQRHRRVFTHAFAAAMEGLDAVLAGLREGLPVGLQLIGRPGSEALLLRVAAAVEASVGPVRQLPRR